MDVNISLENPIHIIALASESDLATRGVFASNGSKAATRETLSLTSLAAVSISVSNVNSILIFDNSSLLSDVISLILIFLPESLLLLTLHHVLVFSMKLQYILLIL